MASLYILSAAPPSVFQANASTTHFLIKWKTQPDEKNVSENNGNALPLFLSVIRYLARVIRINTYLL